MNLTKELNKLPKKDLINLLMALAATNRTPAMNNYLIKKALTDYAHKQELANPHDERFWTEYMRVCELDMNDIGKELLKVKVMQ